jgi:biopolymer transport protein ExbB/TolQ
MNGIETAIFDIAKALRVPVLVLALAAVALTLLELGAFLVELVRRRRRDFIRLEAASSEARAALQRGDETGAKSALRPVAWSTQMARTLAFLVDQWGKPQIADRMAKGLADFDFRSVRRLDRTRLLVRAGPALGLMGTLIPLSPALSGLAKGDVQELQDNLQIAFSVTVLGLLVGAVAFGISLVRDRIYGQDLSDLEFVMTTLVPEGEGGAAAVAAPKPAGAAPAKADGAVPAGAAAAASPGAGAAASDNKPPPPTGAKPLDATLPPPGVPIASGAAGPGVPLSASAAVPDPGAPGSDAAAPPSQTAAPIPDPAAPPAADPARDVTRQQGMPPAPAAPEVRGAPAGPAVPAEPAAPGHAATEPATEQLPPPIPGRPRGDNTHPTTPEGTTSGDEPW